MRAIVWAAIAAWTLGATGAGAARVSEVRVGTHEDGHTRIVVELDSPAGYRLQSPQPGARPELVVDLDATSIQRDVPSKSRVVKKVRVEPSDAGSTVHISLATGDVAVKEMLLANPPRIVLDLKARGAIPKADADAVADEPKAAADEFAGAASAEPSAAAPPTPAKVEVPKSEPVVVASAEAASAAEKIEAPAQRETLPPAATKLTLPSAAAPLEAKHDLMPPPPTDPQADLEPTADEAPAAKPTLIPPIERARSAEQQATAPNAQLPAPSDEERRKAITARPPKTTPSSNSLVDLAMSPMGLAVIGGAVLLLGIVVMRRRRAAEDDDPLYTVMSADDAGAGVSMDAVYPGEEAEDRPPVLASLGPYESDGFEEASEPAVRVGPSGPRQLDLGHASEASEPSAVSMPGDDSDSIFGAEPEVVASPVPVAVVPTLEPSPVAAQAGQISAEVERRVAELERRLEQLTEARERLERQVAAQTEELRVQRAAIARTQRVVRTIAKTEDMATEPVPRAPTA
jgi:hypothetical protein